MKNENLNSARKKTSESPRSLSFNRSLKNKMNNKNQYFREKNSKSPSLINSQKQLGKKQLSLPPTRKSHDIKIIKQFGKVLNKNNSQQQSDKNLKGILSKNSISQNNPVKKIY